MTRSLLNPRPERPKTRKVTFEAPEALVERMQALLGQADAHGFDVAVDDALVAAYGKIARKIERELATALPAGEGGAAAVDLASDAAA
jgi:hypothetical protein